VAVFVSDFMPPKGVGPLAAMGGKAELPDESDVDVLLGDDSEDLLPTNGVGAFADSGGNRLEDVFVLSGGFSSA